MKNTVSIFITIIVATLLFSGCKKYEEGPALTLRSVKGRLTNADWELEKLTVGTIDSTDEYSQIEFSLHIVASSGMGAKKYTYDMSYTYMGQLVEIENGYIYFKDDGDKIIFEPYYYYGSYSYSPIFAAYDSYGGTYLEWEIQKLTNKEFWLETKVGNNKVEMKLKKDK
jgi:hypothetical protein